VAPAGKVLFVIGPIEGKPMAAYFVIDLSIPEPDKLKAYEQLVNPVLRKHRAKVLTRGGPSDYDVIEGDWEPTHLVIIEYPSRQAIHDFYNDSDYRPAKELRLGARGSTANAIAIEGEDDQIDSSNISGDANQKRAYFVTDLTVFDPSKLKDFEAAANNMVRKHGGTFLVRGGDYDVIEGSWHPQRLVIEQFASRRAIRDMFDDPDNQPLKSLRRSASKANALAVDGVEP
jgi:uncharacterized protein (DUF1330 family)